MQPLKITGGAFIVISADVVEDKALKLVLWPHCSELRIIVKILYAGAFCSEFKAE
jgi:hypothetical protein